MDFIEYKEEVRKRFSTIMSNLSMGEIDEYLNGEEAMDIIRHDFECYSTSNITGITPSSTAYCLFMLY